MNIFEKNMLDIYGERGKQWLLALPDMLTNLSQTHQLEALAPVSNMSYNYVTRAYQNQTPVILKIGLDDQALAREAAALQAFSGLGAVQVLAHDKGLLLLACALPGTTLKTYFPEQEEASLYILCAMIKKLHQAPIPKNHDFYAIKTLLKTLDNHLAIPNHILSKARHLRDDLLATSDKTVLLHGDLHHENLLKNKHDWCAIDPKGFIGDPAYEVCAFIRNPIPELFETDNPKKIIAQRIHSCSKLLDLSAQRIHDWFYVQAVLAWAWQLEDNIDTVYISELINLLESYK